MEYKEGLHFIGGSLVLIFLLSLIGFFWVNPILIFKILGTELVLIFIVYILDKSSD